MKRLALALLFLFVGISSLQAQSSFYKGKTVRIIVGGSAGGGFDTYARTMARHMSPHIPGNPTIIVENMTGAATRIAAKYLHSSAKPDGLAFGIFNGYLILGRVLGMKGLDFDVRQYEWVGVPVQDHVVCGIRKASGVTNLKQWFAAKSPVKIGALGPGNSTGDVPRLLRATLGLPLQLVEGYKGTSRIRIAAEGGEVDGACWAWESMKVTWRKGLESGDVNVVVQATPKAQPDLPKVPVAFDLVKTDEARQLLSAGVVAPASITRLFVTTPGTPKDRVQALRKAFSDTLKDPKFLADAKKAKLEVNPLIGDEVGKVVASMYDMKPALKAKLKEVLTAK